MCCIGYIINLAVQAFLFQNIIEIEKLELYNNQESKRETKDKEEKRVKFRLIGPLGQLYNIIIYICSSTTYINKFLESTERMILLDNCTR
jgi:hypothetical protein